MGDPYRGRIDPPVRVELATPPSHLGERQRVDVLIDARMVSVEFVAKEAVGWPGFKWTILERRDSYNP